MGYLGYVDEIMALRNRMLMDYVNLIKKYGKNGELETFDFCSDYGLILNDSTIDKIELSCGTIAIYYSENEGDFNLFRHFDIEDLAQFYDGLAKVVEYEKEYKQSL